MTKREVRKDMILLDWMDEWRIVEVLAESDSSVWVKPRFSDEGLVRKNKKTTDHQFFECDDEGFNAVREKLASKAHVAQKKAAHATNQLHTFIVKINSMNQERAEKDGSIPERAIGHRRYDADSADGES